MKIILGSASEPRQKILREMGHDFEVMKSEFDEKTVRETNPERLVLKLALAKADSLKHKINEDAILITCDTVMVCQGKILEKPSTLREARAFIQGYSGNSASAIASVAVTNIHSGLQIADVEMATIYFKIIPPHIIDELVNLDYTLFCSGAIRIEDPIWQPYVDRIEGDIKTIMGLPPQLTRDLIDRASEHFGD